MRDADHEVSTCWASAVSPTVLYQPGRSTRCAGHLPEKADEAEFGFDACVYAPSDLWDTEEPIDDTSTPSQVVTISSTSLRHSSKPPPTVSQSTDSARSNR